MRDTGRRLSGEGRCCSKRSRNGARLLHGVVVAFTLLALCAWTPAATSANNTGAAERNPELPNLVRLPGHVLAAVKDATPVAPRQGESAEPLTLTITLNLADRAEFERYLRNV